MSLHRLLLEAVIQVWRMMGSARPIGGILAPGNLTVVLVSFITAYL